MSKDVANRQQSFNENLLQFLQRSPTPFHAVASMAQLLDSANFHRLDETQHWQLAHNSRYYVLRNDSALIAFKTGLADSANPGIRLVGTHTDSPCLKIKPLPQIMQQGYLQLGVEVYGGALLHPWFDRDLSIAGRVDFETGAGQLGSTLIDLQRPVAFIPSLAIHLDRSANDGRKINRQTELPPLLMQLPTEQEVSFDQLLLQWVQATEAGESAEKVLAHELLLYDTQPPSILGLEKQFIASARLENLLSCFIAVQALIDSEDTGASLLVCNDHEEVGSASSSGAQGPFLKVVLERLIGGLSAGTEQQSGVFTTELIQRVIRQSILLSIDNAHGVHPNYKDKHDESHRPLLNGGPVIKINANQRYASNSQSIALFKSLCDRLDVPHQSFVMRSDMACGSTIGPITATEIGITTVDIGLASFAMHSIRELAGAEDPLLLADVVTAFYSR